MKNSIKILALLICTQLSASYQPLKIDKSARFASHALGNIELYHDNGSFNVIHNNEFHKIGNECVDQSLRSINSQQLAEFLKNGHISVTKTESETGSKSFVLRAHVHGKGGGNATGKLFGAITKFGGYAGIGIACFFHPDTALHAEELKHAVDLAAVAAEAVGIALPTP